MAPVSEIFQQLEVGLPAEDVHPLGDDNVWGVTAAILAQLANLAYDAGLDLQ